MPWDDFTTCLQNDGVDVGNYTEQNFRDFMTWWNGHTSQEIALILFAAGLGAGGIGKIAALSPMYTIAAAGGLALGSVIAFVLDCWHAL
jgi:hypothetical protein